MVCMSSVFLSSWFPLWFLWDFCCCCLFLGGGWLGGRAGLWWWWWWGGGGPVFYQKWYLMQVAFVNTGQYFPRTVTIMLLWFLPWCEITLASYYFSPLCISLDVHVFHRKFCPDIKSLPYSGELKRMGAIGQYQWRKHMDTLVPYSISICYFKSLATGIHAEQSINYTECLHRMSACC